EIHTPLIEVSKSSQKVTITGNTAHEVVGSGSGWNVSNNKIVSKGHKVSDGDKVPPSKPAPDPKPQPDVDEREPTPQKPAPEKPAPEKPDVTPPTQPSYEGLPTADLVKPQSQAFYASLARDMGLDLRTNGQGGSNDALVLANNGIASAGRGDN